MRTILSFAFACIVFAQPNPAPTPLEAIDRQEHHLLEAPDDVKARVNLLRIYFAKPAGFEPEQSETARRRHALWLVGHHPDLTELGQAVGALEPADPDAQAAWSSQALKPDAVPKALANAAAFFLRITDVAKARALVDAAWRAHPENPDAVAAQGAMDVLTMVGATRRTNPQTIIVPDPAAAKSPEALQARREIEMSKDASLLGGAGRQLNQIQGIVAAQSLLGDEDPLPLALKWSTRAHELDPRNAVWTQALVQVYITMAGALSDPRGKVQWLVKASAIADTDALQLSFLMNLMNAELDAGDASATERDALRLLALADKNPKRGDHDDLVHAAHTALGRVALDRNDVSGAKEHLLQSVRVKGSGGLANGGPRFTLAQELYDRGERDVVIEYLEACRALWTYDQGKLDHYIKLAKRGTRNDVFANWSPPGTALVGHAAPPLPALEQFAGDRVAVIFWNTACKGCAEEIAAFAKENVPVIAVNSGDDESMMREFAAKKHIAVPVAVAGRDAIRLYEVESYPTTVVMDAEGRVTAYRVGRIAAGQEQALLKTAMTGRLRAPIPLTSEHDTPGMIRLAWSPVEGAQSYVVEWEPREAKGWPSDRDGLLRVIPTVEPAAELDCPEVLRWRVYAVSRSGAGDSSAWRELLR